MATWLVHLRVADILLDRIANLSPVEFVVGNIAPDSGIPNEDWSKFTPSGDVSHFKTTDDDGLKDIHLDKYIDHYFTKSLRVKYDYRQKSFYLGYLTHLMTDMHWANDIVRPGMNKFRTLYEESFDEWIWTLKKDWYDLDFLYLQEHPDFRAFSIYKNAAGFLNHYISFFSDDAFDIRREYIAGFYGGQRYGLDREYHYLTEKQMNNFVSSCADTICTMLYEKGYI